MALFAIEFVTDKIPYVDHVWDTVHTAIRPTIAAVIGVLLNEQAEGLHDALAAVGSSATAVASHGVKAALRAGRQHLARPGHDRDGERDRGRPRRHCGALIVTHPWVALALSMLLLAIGITIVAYLWRQIRVARDRRRAGLAGAIRRFVSANDMIFLNAGPATVPP